MQRNIIPTSLAALLIFMAGPAEAGGGHTGGVCYDCHSMHNSQDGMPMRFDGIASPLPMLLRGDCVTCHTGLASMTQNAAASVKKSVKANAVKGISNWSFSPPVMSLTPPTYTWGNSSGINGGTLAGGSFYWVASNDALGHNVTAIPGIMPDTRLGKTPPGGAALTSPLQCAGVNGCHGDAEVSANPLRSLAQGHHTNARGEVDGKTVGTSYRFLLGVRGVEDDDWEWTVSDTDHNLYVGEVRAVDTTRPSAATISGNCAKCHGDFHNSASGRATAGEGGDTGFVSPWVRHPNDYDMGMTGDYAGYATYNSKVPVARTTGTLSMGSNAAVRGNQRIIMCLTCHRAHGSPYSAMLRWNYRAWPAAANQNGCQVCHTSKF